MNGGQNFGTVNQQQNNNCDVLTGDLQQQLHLHQNQQVHQHLALPSNQQNHQQLQLQESASSPLLMLEDRGSNLEQAGPQLQLPGAPPLAPTDQQQSAPVRQAQSLLSKAGNSGQSVVAEPGISSAPSAARFAPRRATSANRSQSRCRNSSRGKRRRGQHGLAPDSASTAGSDLDLTDVSSTSDDDPSSIRQGREPHSSM